MKNIWWGRKKGITLHSLSERKQADIKKTYNRPIKK